MIDIQITGLEDVKKMLGSLGKQADFAASRALNTTAFKINAEVKTEMNRAFAGGATPYTLRAMKVEKSDSMASGRESSARIRSKAVCGRR